MIATLRQKSFYMCQILSLLLLVLSWTTLVSCEHHHLHHHHHQQLCSEPEDLKEQMQSLQSYDSGHLHDTFLLLPSLRDLMVNNTAGQLASTNCSRVFSGSDKCPRSDILKTSSGDPCPTYTCINHDINRYPRVLLETRCSCTRRCRGISKGRGQMTTPNCEAVFYHVRALRRTGCQDGVYQYASVWEPLQVGCACRLFA